MSNGLLLDKKELDLLLELRQDLKIDPLPQEKIIEVEEVENVVKNFFDNLKEKFAEAYLPGQINNLYRKLSGKDHPEFVVFLSNTSTFFGT